MDPKAAVRIVAVVLGPIGRPAAARTAGLTTSMYAMVTKVVSPPRTSRPAVDPLALTPDSFSSIGEIYMRSALPSLAYPRWRDMASAFAIFAGTGTGAMFLLSSRLDEILSLA